MAPHELDAHSSRETRLLAIVIVVAIAVLLLIARFRFPSAKLDDVAPGSSSLAGLAARAAFDEMGTTMSNLLDRVGPAIAILQVEPIAGAGKPEGLARPEGVAKKDARARGRAGSVSAAESGSDLPRLVPALRLRSDLAVVYVPPGMRITGELGAPDHAVAVTPQAPENVAVVELSTLGTYTTLVTLDGFAGVRYVGIVTAAQGGATIQPGFIGRATDMAGVGWPKPLLAIPASPEIPAGAFLFAIDGRLIGMATHEAGQQAIVPAALLSALTSVPGPRGSSPP